MGDLRREGKYPQGANDHEETRSLHGINDYPGTGSDLAGCVNDAHDWGEALTARGFSVAHLLDKQATGAAMRAAIKSVIGKAASGDVVVIQ